MALKKQLSVFVSSTSKDLDLYRTVAGQVIRARGWTSIMNEDWGARPGRVVDECYREVGAADLVLLIMAFRQGFVPAVEQGGNGIDSMTALEIAHARKNDIPVLGLLANEQTWPGSQYEKTQIAREWVDKFRAEFGQPAEFFDPEQWNPAAEQTYQLPQFRAKVGGVLLSYYEKLLANQPKISTGDESGFFDNARTGIADGTSIPFIGAGVYGDGGLSAREISRALGAEAGADEGVLATAAEFRERSRGSRPAFLLDLHREITQRTKQLTTFPPFYEMLLKAPRPPLIVSSTCDMVLEDSLKKNGREYVLVCHIVRSRGNENDGKILLFDGDKYEISVADKIALPRDKYIIYKPLGSPLLHERISDPGIDTVVITESDHLLLLGRLEHELTQIPTTFHRTLQNFPLLFAGYGLDVWHYRLVMQVFQLVHAQGSRPTPTVVREPASRMEVMAWRRLGADVLPMPIDDFAHRVMATLDGNVGEKVHEKVGATDVG